MLLAAMVMAFRVSACTVDTPPPSGRPEATDSQPAVVVTQTSSSILTQPAEGEAGIEDLLTQYPCTQINEPETAQLIRVIDGDTVDVRMGGQEYRVRYIGINAPESDEGLGSEASQANADLVEGQTLYLVQDESETDLYGRLLRYVFTSGVFVNYELAAQGWARQGDYPPDTACSETLKNAEQTARDAGLGLWADSEAGSNGSAIEIVNIFYNGEAGENEPDEYVEIRNAGAETVNLTGWYLKDQGSNRFVFPDLEMKAGEICRIYTNENHSESCRLSFEQSGSAVWNNGGDCAALYNPEGYLINEYCYP